MGNAQHNRRMAAEYGADAIGWLLTDEDESAHEAGRAARHAAHYARKALRDEAAAATLERVAP